MGHMTVNPEKRLLLHAFDKLRLDKKRQQHACAQDDHGHFSTVGCIAIPGAAVLKPEKQVHGSNPGGKRDHEPDRFPDLCIQ